MFNNLRLLKRVVARDGAACRACGATKRLSLDHIVPRIAGGTDAMENLQVLCIPCNAEKGGDAKDWGEVVGKNTSVYLRRGAISDLLNLQSAWGLSRSATIARALEAAAKSKK